MITRGLILIIMLSSLVYAQSFPSPQIIPKRCNFDYYCDYFEDEEECPSDCKNGGQQQAPEPADTEYLFEENQGGTRQAPIIKEDDKSYNVLITSMVITVLLVILLLFSYFWIYQKKNNKITPVQEKEKAVQKRQIKPTIIKSPYNLPSKPIRRWLI